jgi:glycosyltransferase involved in cell wall biosynthesis
MRDIVPIKTYEYLACGKPLIATKLPGIMKEFKQNNGVVYVDSAKDVLPLVIELSQIPDRIAEIGRNAVDFVTPLAWPELTLKFENLLEQSCRQKVETTG